MFLKLTTKLVKQKLQKLRNGYFRLLIWVENVQHFTVQIQYCSNSVIKQKRETCHLFGFK